MKRFLSLILILSFFQTFTSCKKEEDPKNKILPLGASRVDGAYPLFESYRFELWKLLQSDNVNVDFVGTQKDHAIRPDVNGVPFDLDHEGRSSWNSGQIYGNLEFVFSNIDAPDFVLFSSPGGNDALQELPYENAIKNIEGIIKKIQQKNPKITILIEQMAPGHSDIMEGELLRYFNLIETDVYTIAAKLTTPTSKVIVVDMASGFKDEFLADNIHYNEAGAKLIAKKYFEVLKPLLR